jgi:hypothetical protein
VPQLKPRNQLGVFVEQSDFSASFNRALLAQYLAAKDINSIKKTHFFNARYENIYLNEQQAPALRDLKADAKQHAAIILEKPIDKIGCWFNAMPHGTSTSLHRHDDDDERLSGVYYVSAPSDSGCLIIHTTAQNITHSPITGQWVFFSPQTPPEVTKNQSRELILSVAFNFSCD